MVLEDTLEHRAQVCGRPEIATFEQISILKTRPVGDHTATLQCAADQQRDCGCAMVSAVGSGDARGAAELRYNSDYGLAPSVAHTVFDCGNGAVERTEQRRQKPAGHAFIEVRVPSTKRKRTDARAIGPGEKSRGRTGGFSKVGAHPRLAGSGWLALRRRRCVP